jgi:plasmid stabilization system protein ParE
MSFRVTRSLRAAAEVRQIALYLADQSPAAARRFQAALEHAQQQLAVFPNSGERGVLPDTRRLIVGNYLVHYRRRGDDLQIFAVRDARRRDARDPR